MSSYTNLREKNPPRPSPFFLTFCDLTLAKSFIACKLSSFCEYNACKTITHNSLKDVQIIKSVGYCQFA